MIINLHKRYIENTQEGAFIEDAQAFVCKLTSDVSNLFSSEIQSVYINTRVLKHIYDKRGKRDYDFIIKNIGNLIKYPNNIYKNQIEKRGSICFVKSVNGSEYMVSLEQIKNSNTLEVVTIFMIRKKNYLDGYKLLWSWEDGDIPPS